LLAQMAADLCQFTFAPEAALKVISTLCALSRFEEGPLEVKGVNEGLIPDEAPPRQGKAFYFVFGVR
jgi:hypothetical protein